MSIAIALLAFAAAPGTADRPLAKSADSAKQCRRTETRPVKQQPQSARPHPLEDEPLANDYLGVWHFVGKCEKPIIVRENIGGTGR